MNSWNGKIFLALTAFMLVQHGVRHLLLADDQSYDDQIQAVPLLDAYHPFPSTPPIKRVISVDPTPIRTTISVAEGQIVAIGSLDRSIRLHEIQLTIRPAAASKQSSMSDQMWFDIADVGPLMQASGEERSLGPDLTDAIQTAAARSANAASPNAKQPVVSRTTRRFQLPYFRNGNVYERTLIRQLIDHDDRITIYGDSSNRLHLEAATQILACDTSSVLNFTSQAIGPITDLDGDDRLALVLGQLSDAIPPHSTQEPIRGCVRPADFQIGKHSSADVIYLDPKHLQVSQLQSLLAHEFAHAATFSLLVKSGQTPTTMPGWLNEAIAHQIELQIAPQSENLQQRRHLYRAATWQYPSAIPDEFTGMELRRGPSRIASMELLQSSLKGRADHTLKDLIVGRGDGISRLQDANQEDFPKLFRSFTQHIAEQQTMVIPESNQVAFAKDKRQPAFELADSRDQSIQLRGTAVAISSPALTDCEVEIVTTRDAQPQITLARPQTAN